MHGRTSLACLVVFLLAVVSCVAPSAAVAAEPAETPLFWPLYSSSDADVDAWEAWDVSVGDDVTVGVIDQSVFREHVKFGGRVDQGVDFVEDAVDAECEVAVPTGPGDHGTLVAGLIAAQHGGVDAANGAYNLAGLAPGARIRPIRAVNNCGKASVPAVLRGIRYAHDENLPIAVVSLQTSPLLEPAEQRAIAADLDEAFRYAGDTLFVVAAGNLGNDNDVPGRQVYPCSSEAPNVVCVGMTGEPVPSAPTVVHTDAPVCWGNVGATSVDLFAPGLGINSTARVNGFSGYARRDGTSLAAPLVAAAAALIEATDPRTFGPAQLKAALIAGVDGKSGLQTVSTSGGRLNAAKLLGVEGRIGTGTVTQPWTTCDRDHDEVRDKSDNCPDKVNKDQDDDDGDDVGNECDDTRRGVDFDGDTVGALDDSCPRIYALTSNGCPVPEPTPTVSPSPTPTSTPTSPQPRPTPEATPEPDTGPQITSFIVKSTKSRTAKVTIRLSRKAKVSLKVELKVGRNKWKRVTATSVTASVGVKRVTLRPKGAKRFKRGSYRVIATVGRRVETKSFTVK